MAAGLPGTGTVSIGVPSALVPPPQTSPMTLEYIARSTTNAAAPLTLSTIAAKRLPAASGNAEATRTVARLWPLIASWVAAVPPVSKNRVTRAVAPVVPVLAIRM